MIGPYLTRTIVAQCLDECADLERDYGFAGLARSYRDRAAEIRRIANEADREGDAPEQPRPEWARGHSSDSVAAQVSSIALAQIYAALGVADQTEAIQAIETLKVRAVPHGYDATTLKLGDPCHVTEKSNYYEDWKRTRLWFAGLTVDRQGEPNAHVAEEWPVTSLGLTDGFKPEEIKYGHSPYTDPAPGKAD